MHKIKGAGNPQRRPKKAKSKGQPVSRVRREEQEGDTGGWEEGDNRVGNPLGETRTIATYLYQGRENHVRQLWKQLGVTKILGQVMDYSGSPEFFIFRHPIK